VRQCENVLSDSEAGKCVLPETAKKSLFPS
jgi:hypothetical protein